MKQFTNKIHIYVVYIFKNLSKNYSFIKFPVELLCNQPTKPKEKKIILEDKNMCFWMILMNLTKILLLYYLQIK